MEGRKIVVVVVEEVEAARTALHWALHNLVRYGDLVTLLHVFPSTRSRNKKKILRLKGFQLALSFKDMCNNFPNTRTEIVVTEDDQEGGRIVAMVREIGASTLVVGLHDQSFLYKLAMAHSYTTANTFNCKVLAIKQPTPLTTRRTHVADCSTNMDFSQIEIAGLSLPDIPPPKIPYRICPNPSAIIWRSGRARRKRNS
ncbi:hypothetical protein RJ639_008059 [Escallonia herrerae]|uniref:UspA domain-containing protein n=1 Tax=Escallonia herrerae TaxID=1293975 RepID=A0AA89AWZ4_9ASTE|nr:hypothetical protein RJ639_008059 [Escallonia herrerae]